MDHHRRLWMVIGRLLVCFGTNIGTSFDGYWRLLTVIDGYSMVIDGWLWTVNGWLWRVMHGLDGHVCVCVCV